jgi:hypothetical protein
MLGCIIRRTGTERAVSDNQEARLEHSIFAVLAKSALLSDYTNVSVIRHNVII